MNTFLYFGFLLVFMKEIIGSWLPKKKFVFGP